MRISSTSKQNIAFKGIEQDIEFSRAIVRDIRSEFPRTASDTFVEAKIMQHLSNPDYSDLISKLELIAAKYKSRRYDLRYDFQVLCNTHDQKDKRIEALKSLMHSYNTGNCGELSLLVQHEHLIRGVNSHVVGFEIDDRKIIDKSRNHVFTLRNIPKKINFRRPSTWGNAIIADAWCGSGVVGKAIEPKGRVKKGVLRELLDFMCFNPEKERIRFFLQSSF